MMKEIRFFRATLMLFLERTDPASRQVKPACMKNTKAVQAMSHRFPI
jgi:hypothetical protein